ncbi:uncharacterized protein LAESUDRAFT_762863 [Laetiporus sulphureus 93-53]|uniref:CCHC-type domain-containing protein n=1 Tax=Laetiporus sulphureus 93-53 TaxID=1314785 RepID=A0A165C6P0_9APHY|nr:uncharacterized protein LAESUDRAFT_762863 [Laetiporus sulphureus 93-53]KZT02294.1 hypothetical protein LAESUDRAFT_762863 [Laetiporus sulphureus 93-53]
MSPELSTFISQLSSTVKAARRIQEAITPSTVTAATPAQLKAFEKETPDLPPEVLMELALEEWDRRHGTSKGKGAKPDPGVAAAVLSSEKLKSWKGKKGPWKPVGVCWNCGGKGHRQDNCSSPKQDSKDAKNAPDAKTDQAKPKPTAASAVDLNAIAGAWTAIDFDLSDVESTCPSIFSSAGQSDYTALTEADSDASTSVPDLERTADDLSEVSEGHEEHAIAPVEAVPEVGDGGLTKTVPLAERMLSVQGWLGSLASEEDMPVDAGDDPIVLPDVAAVAVALVADAHQPRDLYDSGVSHHMSPYREDFLTFHEIMP